ncbi:MAG: response regulator [Candidatus Omnitrophica bacterium]|nr:response regulator [Candidatus Omnitrophota bacterium]
MIKELLQRWGIKKAPKEDFGCRCVLVVDDNKVDLTLLKRTVEKMGHRVLTAENGVAGLQLAKKERPDLILSDCRMPEMDGVAMYKQMMEDPELKDIPFVFLTAVDSPNNIVECFDIGAANYICKPIKPKLLAGQITAIFKEHFGSST